MNIKIFEENLEYINKEFFEEKQTTQLKFCFLSETESKITNVTPWCLCRDFINDTYNWVMHYDLLPNLEVYEYKHNKISMSNINLLGLKFPSQKTYINFLSNFHILNTLEKFYDSKTQSKFTENINKKNEIILSIDISSFWLENSSKLSFFTFLLRQFCINPNIKNIWNNLKKDESSTDYTFYYTIKNIYINSYNYYITNLNNLSNNNYILDMIKNHPNKTNDPYFSIWKKLHNNGGFLYYISNLALNHYDHIKYDQNHSLYPIY